MILFLLGVAWTTVVVMLGAIEVLRRTASILGVHSAGAAARLLLRSALRSTKSDPGTIRRRISRSIGRRSMTFGPGRTYAMTSFVVRLPSEDLSALTDSVPLEILIHELRQDYRATARRQRWIGGEAVRIQVESGTNLPRGALDVEARLTQPKPRVSPARHRTEPSGRDDTTVLLGDRAESKPSTPANADDTTRKSCSAMLRYRGTSVVVSAEDGPIPIGRSASSPIGFGDAGVSRDHAVLDHRDGCWTIRPTTGAKNGTFLEGLPIESETTLPGRCIVRLGRHAALEFSTTCRHAEER